MQALEGRDKHLPRKGQKQRDEQPAVGQRAAWAGRAGAAIRDQCRQLRVALQPPRGQQGLPGVPPSVAGLWLRWQTIGQTPGPNAVATARGKEHKQQAIDMSSFPPCPRQGRARSRQGNWGWPHQSQASRPLRQAPGVALPSSRKEGPDRAPVDRLFTLLRSPRCRCCFLTGPALSSADRLLGRFLTCRFFAGFFFKYWTGFQQCRPTILAGTVPVVAECLGGDGPPGFFLCVCVCVICFFPSGPFFLLFLGPASNTEVLTPSCF